MKIGENSADDYHGMIEDGFLRFPAGLGNRGGHPGLFVGTGSDPTRHRFRSLLRVKNLADILGPNAIIRSGKLYAYCEAEGDTAAETIGVYRVLQNWVEGDGFDYQMGSYDERYYVRDTGPWNGQGLGVTSDVEGERSTADRRTTRESGTSITGTGTWFSWDVTAACRNWYSRAWSEYGIVLINDDETDANTYKRFSSSEDSDDGLRPYVEIVVEGSRIASPSVKNVEIHFEKINPAFLEGWTQRKIVCTDEFPLMDTLLGFQVPLSFQGSDPEDSLTYIPGDDMDYNKLRMADQSGTSELNFTLTEWKPRTVELTDKGRKSMSLWNWSNSQVVRTGDRVHFVFIGATSCSLFAGTYYTDRDSIGGPYFIAAPTFDDAHNYPLLLKDSKDMLYCFYYDIGRTPYLKKSTFSGCASSWGSPQRVAGARYCNVPKAGINANDEIYFYYRSGNVVLTIAKSIDGGRSWTKKDLVWVRGILVYPGGIAFGDETPVPSVHLTWWSRRAESMWADGGYKNTFYMVSYDSMATWRSADSSAYTLPVGENECECIYDSLCTNTIVCVGNEPVVIVAPVCGQIAAYHFQGSYWDCDTISSLRIPMNWWGTARVDSKGEIEVVASIRDTTMPGYQIVKFASADTGDTWTPAYLTRYCEYDQMNPNIEWCSNDDNTAVLYESNGHLYLYMDDMNSDHYIAKAIVAVDSLGSDMFRNICIYYGANSTDENDPESTYSVFEPMMNWDQWWEDTLSTIDDSLYEAVHRRFYGAGDSAPVLDSTDTGAQHWLKDRICDFRNFAGYRIHTSMTNAPTIRSAKNGVYVGVLNDENRVRFAVGVMDSSNMEIYDDPYVWIGTLRNRHNINNFSEVTNDLEICRYHSDNSVICLIDGHRSLAATLGRGDRRLAVAVTNFGGTLFSPFLIVGPITVRHELATMPTLRNIRCCQTNTSKEGILKRIIDSIFFK